MEINTYLFPICNGKKLTSFFSSSNISRNKRATLVGHCGGDPSVHRKPIRNNGLTACGYTPINLPPLPKWVMSKAQIVLVERMVGWGLFVCLVSRADRKPYTRRVSRPRNRYKCTDTDSKCRTSGRTTLQENRPQCVSVRSRVNI